MHRAARDTKTGRISWIILFVAGLLEIGWAIGLKYADGFTKLWATVGTVCGLAASFLLLGLICAGFVGLKLAHG